MRFYSHSRFSVPSAWETWASNARSQNALSFLKVEELHVKYVGPGEDDRQAATILANHPVPLDCPLFYFEIKVLNRGAEGFIGIGYQTEEVALSRLPGWESHSYGYHGDDGHIFGGNGRGTPFGPKYSTGDVIGCLLDRTNRTIQYYKNGTSLGVAFREVMEEQLRPCVGLRTQGEEISANFGGQAFVADFDSVLATYKNQVSSAVASIPLPLVSSRGSPLIPQLLHDHLLHHRCPETAAILARDMLQALIRTIPPLGTDSVRILPFQGGASSSPSSGSGAPGGSSGPSGLADVAGRQLVYELVVSGRVGEAVSEVSRLFTSGPIDGSPGLGFKIKIARFCELLRGPGGAEAALTYARSDLRSDLRPPHSPSSKQLASEEELLNDALSLLAYEQPQASPCGHMLSQAAFNSLAEALNGAILRHQGLPAVSALERAFQQVSVVLDLLRAQNVPQATVIDLRQMALGDKSSGKV